MQLSGKFFLKNHNFFQKQPIQMFEHSFCSFNIDLSKHIKKIPNTYFFSRYKQNNSLALKRPALNRTGPRRRPEKFFILEMNEGRREK